MNGKASVPYWTAAAIWGLLLLTLWAVSWQMQGGSSIAGHWSLRNSDLAALFAAHDAPAPPPVAAARAPLDSKQPVKSAQPVKPSASAGGGIIDLNRATAADLEKLPGIGPSKANAIIQYRQAQGPFTSVEQLKNVKGIGDKTLETLKPFLSVGNEAGN
ncbi:MAG: competence ComEA helix-hairpin-helix repeat region domain protein [Paenibacillus sp.]|nr:competence ComEA helix-hairpin-helix repeat region domain protein [Paenibacillus sp.]